MCPRGFLGAVEHGTLLGVVTRCAALGLALLLLGLSPRVSAFPGLVLAKDGVPRAVPSTTVVVMRHRGISILTLSAAIQGPLEPFALLLPVPSDVRASHVETVRRGLLSRVEQVSAPRFYAFYEADPCSEGQPDPGFRDHVKARGAGFLALPGLPPLDRHYAVSNAISLPVQATFKAAESEFSYRDLVFSGAAKLASELTARGYRATEHTLEPLSRELYAGKRLLLAEVSPARVELAPHGRIQLGGVRFSTREPLDTLREGLGAASPGVEELFVYVLDRDARAGVAGRADAFVPASVRVEPRVAEHLATAYDALFDAFVARHPEAFVTEFAWPTSGCGEPCPDAPLAPDELLTLGGDVLEEATTTPAERAPEPPPEPTLEHERFETHLAELPPGERASARREHLAERREIERRRALAARQTYVLTRLHHRYTATSERRDLELVPAPPVSGGTGVPEGPRGKLSSAVSAARDNRLEVRFYALNPWDRAIACSAPKRFRWGKRWASEARSPRAVPLALDLAAAPRTPRLLEDALLDPIPELGLAPAAPSAAPAPPALPSAAPPRASSHRGCALTASPEESGAPGAVLALLVAALAVRRPRRRARAQRDHGELWGYNAAHACLVVGAMARCGARRHFARASGAARAVSRGVRAGPAAGGEELR